ncbi:MAG: SUMF1/EgtB/PvdO family nonheme iron enzyme [Candidatus Hydrogenedentes bacterium]|nr:SUMF1/EgtB/PvdO family nonheme iron enzyme [Candidatus Hydrogenedentota bacterium]
MRCAVVYQTGHYRATKRVRAGRLLRGGNWNNNANNCRAANRNNNNPNNRNNNIGFRLACASSSRMSEPRDGNYAGVPWGVQTRIPRWRRRYPKINSAGRPGSVPRRVARTWLCRRSILKI